MDEKKCHEQKLLSILESNKHVCVTAEEMLKKTVNHLNSLTPRFCNQVSMMYLQIKCSVITTVKNLLFVYVENHL